MDYLVNFRSAPTAAAPNLSNEELKHMTRAIGEARLQAANMAGIVEDWGMLIADDENDGWDVQSRFPQLLFQLSNQFDVLAGMIELGEDARYRLDNPEKPEV
jgi:hypothetical protein